MKKLTITTKPQSENDIKRGWVLFDAKGKILGRLATEIAKVLMGKDKVTYVPYLDMGDNVVVINSKEIEVTGNKEDDKIYTKYSGYPGGLKKTSFFDLKTNNPNEIIKRAVSGMLPKNKLRKRRLSRLFISENDKHSFSDKFNK